MNFNGHFNFFRRFIGIYQRILIFFSFSFNLSCIYKKISAKLYLSAFFIEISALLQFFRRICKFIERSRKNISFSSFIGVIFEDFGENLKYFGVNAILSNAYKNISAFFNLSAFLDNISAETKIFSAPRKLSGFPRKISAILFFSHQNNTKGRDYTSSPAL